MSTISTVVSIASIENLLIEMQGYTTHSTFSVEEYGSILASKCDRLESYRKIFQDRVSKAQKALDRCELSRSSDPEDDKRSCAAEESALAKASADYAKYDCCMRQLYAALTEYRKSESQFFSEIDVLKSKAVPSLSSKLNLLKTYSDAQLSDSCESDRNCIIPVRVNTSNWSKYGDNQGSGVYIGDGKFKGIDNGQTEIKGEANMENVKRYMSKVSDFIYDFIDNPRDLGIALPALFLMVTSSSYFLGYDVNVIRNKLPQKRTPDEAQAIVDYNEFVNQICDKIIATAERDRAKLKETKVFEMAVLSDMAYCRGYESLKKTNYVLIDRENQDQYKEIQSLINSINVCNKIGSDAHIGFSVSAFYNAKTNEYTLAFRGSDDLFDYLHNNIPQNLWGADAPQYIIADTIAQAIKSIPDDVKINLTGHSLGGGLASLVGAITGKETVTFNAAGVHPRTLEKFGVNPDSDFTHNISAYSLKGEVLTSLQEYADLIKSNKLAKSGMFMISPALAQTIISFDSLPLALGEKHIIEPSFSMESNLEKAIEDTAISSAGAVIGGSIGGPIGAVGGAVVASALASDEGDSIKDGTISGISETVSQIAKKKGIPSGAVAVASVAGAALKDSVEKHKIIYLIDEFEIRQKTSEQYQYYEQAINSVLRQKESGDLYKQETILIQM